MAKKTVYISADNIERFIKCKNIVGKKYYLYAHLRVDSNDPFYIGIGTLNKKRYDRALCTSKRNILWKRIANKTRHVVIIIDESESKEEIIRKEKNYISMMGKKCNHTGCLSNITDGGEGALGHSVVWTDEMRIKASASASKRYTSNVTRDKLRILIKERSFFGKVNNARPICQIDKDTNEIVKEYPHSVEAAKDYGIAAQSIRAACNKGTVSKGYKWRYKNA